MRISNKIGIFALKQARHYMFIEFDKDYLRELSRARTHKRQKAPLSARSYKGHQKAVASLKRAINVEMLYRLNSLNYEVLKGDKKAFHRYG